MSDRYRCELHVTRRDDVEPYVTRIVPVFTISGEGASEAEALNAAHAELVKLRPSSTLARTVAAFSASEHPDRDDETPPF